MSNPLPPEYHVRTKPISEEDRKRCESLAGNYMYEGELLQGELHGNRPNIADLLLRRSAEPGTDPQYFRLDLTRHTQNKFLATFQVRGTKLRDENALLIERRRVAHCNSGVLKMTYQYSGSTDGTPIASWEAVEIGLGKSGIRVEVTVSVKIWPFVARGRRKLVVQFEKI